MGLFHRHSYSTFTCPASEIAGIKLLMAKDIQNNTVFLMGSPNDHRCPDHPSRPLRSDGECYSCNYRVVFMDQPKLDEVLVTYKVCLTCGDYTVNAQCGKFKYSVNKEYVKLKIESVKKEKDEAEMERLLNLGNPDYKPTKVAVGKTNAEYEKVIAEYKESISKLQTYLRAALSRLNHSLKNDGIWEALPPKVRKDLIIKYGDKAASYDPVSMEDLAMSANKA